MYIYICNYVYIYVIMYIYIYVIMYIYMPSRKHSKSCGNPWLFPVWKMLYFHGGP